MKRRSLFGSLLLLAGGLLACGTDAAAGTDDARLAHATSRCLELIDLIACGDALNTRPNSPELLVAEADTLLRLKRPGEAIGVYRNALTVGANRSALEPRIAAARTLRRALLKTCLVKQGVAAELACESAWLPGAPDEVAVFKRRGLLLQNSGAASAALDAYMAAARLAPKDRNVERAIVALAAVTGRKDPPALGALAAARERLRMPERRAAAPRIAVLHGKARRGTVTPGARVSGATKAAVNAQAALAPAVPPDTYSNLAEVTRSN